MERQQVGTDRLPDVARAIIALSNDPTAIFSNLCL
jgi:hypothetical protein